MYKSIAVALTLVAVLGCASLAQATVIGQWEFNEKAPGQQTTGAAGEILDSSGNAHHGTAVGNPLPSYSAGPWTTPSTPPTSAIALTAKAVNQDPNEDRVVVPHNAAFNLMLGDLQDYTIEALIKTTKDGGVIMSKSDNDNLCWAFRVGLSTNPALNGVPSLYVQNTDGHMNFFYPNDAHGNTKVDDGQWHHVAVAIDSNSDPLQSKATFYVDKVLDGTCYFNDLVYRGGAYGSNTWLNLNIVNSSAVEIGDMANHRVEDQFVGDLDGVAFSTGLLGPSNFVLPAVGVPEPGAVTLLLTGLVGLLAYAWRRRK
jgi:hypothetical protein